MNFTYATNSTALRMPINNCSMIFNSTKDQYGYIFPSHGWCNCQHCASNCSIKPDFSQYIEQRGLLSGLQSSVLVRAAVVAMIMVVIGVSLR